MGRPLSALVPIALIIAATVFPQNLQTRVSYTIPLAKLGVSIEPRTGRFESVRISYGGSADYTVITRYDDFRMKMTSDGIEKSIYAEDPEAAFMISPFEAKEMAGVCKCFIAALKQFEDNLHHGKWGKCLYLDAYLPRFLKGFFYLYNALRNSSTAMPRDACVPDSLYEVSESSPLSDARVRAWQQGDRVIKLRIITKELMYQLEEWQNKEIGNPKRNNEVSYGTALEEAFTLFVKSYFNITSAPPPAGAKR